MHRGLPSTTLTMIFSIDGPVVGALEDPGRPGPAPPRADLVLAGLHTAPVLVEQPAQQEGIQLEIDPLMARALFGVRASDLVGGFDGAEVLGRAGADLWEQVGETEDSQGRVARIARAFRSRIADAPARTAEVRADLAEAWRLIHASRGRITVEELGRRVLLSPRQLRTEFTREFGLGPKSASRLARFDGVLGRIADSVHDGDRPDLSAVAAAAGYADHAHLTREFTRFTGVSPSRWIEEERRNLQAGGHGTAED